MANWWMNTVMFGLFVVAKSECDVAGNPRSCPVADDRVEDVGSCSEDIACSSGSSERSDSMLQAVKKGHDSLNQLSRQSSVGQSDGILKGVEELPQSDESTATPFVSLLQRAVEDPSFFRRIASDFGGNLTREPEQLQSSLVSLLHDRREWKKKSASLSLLRRGNGSLTTGLKLDLDDTETNMAKATGSMVASIATGEKIDAKSITNQLFPAAATLLTAINPVLGLCASFAMSLFGGLFGSDDEAPTMSDVLQDLYKQIMAEVKQYVSEEIVKAQLAVYKQEVADLVEELQWVPSLMNGASDVQQAKLAYYLMIQHYIASLKSKIFNPECIKEAQSRYARANWDLGPLQDDNSYYTNPSCKKFADTGAAVGYGTTVANLHLSTMATIVIIEPDMAKGIQEKVRELVVMYRNVITMNFNHLQHTVDPGGLHSQSLDSSRARTLTWLNENVCRGQVGLACHVQAFQDDAFPRPGFLYFTKSNDNSCSEPHNDVCNDQGNPCQPGTDCSDCKNCWWDLDPKSTPPRRRTIPRRRIPGATIPPRRRTIAWSAGGMGG